MGLKKAFDIAGTHFDSRVELEGYVQAMLSRHRRGERVCPEEAYFLLALVSRHPKAEEKIGCGIGSFKVDSDPHHPTKCFWIVRLDGTTTDFSYKKCFADENPLSRFSSACRTAVIDQILAFKEQQFDNRWSSVTSEMTGARVGYDSCHVDHEPPFRDLVRRFIEQEGLDPATIEITAGGDGSTCDTFVDINLASRFADFHVEHAHLRIVTGEENLRRPRKDLAPPTLDF